MTMLADIFTKAWLKPKLDFFFFDKWGIRNKSAPWKDQKLVEITIVLSQIIGDNRY